VVRLGAAGYWDREGYRMRGLTRFSLVLVLVVLGVAVIGCTDMPEGLSMGESAEAGGWMVTVESVESFDDSEIEPAEEGNVFLVADVTFENTTDEETWWDTAAVLMMRDSEDTVYPSDGMIVANDIEIVMGSAQPADPRSGLVGFEVPGDATGLVLVFTPEELGEGEEAPEWAVGDVSDL
jgi:hypothetical protein